MSEWEAQKVITYSIPKVIEFAIKAASVALPGEKKVVVIGVSMYFRGAILETTVDGLRSA